MTEEENEERENQEENKDRAKAWLLGQEQVERAQLQPKLKKMEKKLAEHGFKTKKEKRLEQSLDYAEELLDEEKSKTERLETKTNALTVFLETLAKLDREEIEKFQTLLKQVEMRRQIAQHLLWSMAKIDTEQIQKECYEQLKKEIFDNLYEVVEPSGKHYLTLKGRENEIKWEIRRKKRKRSVKRQNAKKRLSKRPQSESE